MFLLLLLFPAADPRHCRFARSVSRVIRKIRRDIAAGVTVVGLGNWGTSLVHALLGAGIPLREVIVRARRAGFRAQELPVTTFDHARLDAAILWLCVPDSAISIVARRIAERVARRAGKLSDQIVVHSSGALNVQVLEPTAEAGASVASVHPVMTFPSRDPVSLQGVPFGIEANALTGRKLRSIVRRLGGQPFVVPGSGKAIYHAAGTLASPLLVAHLAAACQAASLAGLPPRQVRSLIEPIVQATLKNVFSKNVSKSFSGPLARGDVATIDLHLRALTEHPILADVYRSLALFSLGSLPVHNRQRLRHVLESSTSRRGTKGSANRST
jgi:predicted short-subunit dehydrogenase-like oxidoreductase (DUF2520 family)